MVYISFSLREMGTKIVIARMVWVSFSPKSIMYLLSIHLTKFCHLNYLGLYGCFTCNRHAWNAIFKPENNDKRLLSIFQKFKCTFTFCDIERRKPNGSPKLHFSRLFPFTPHKLNSDKTRKIWYTMSV